MTDTLPVIIDTETTGIDLDHDSVVQLAAVMYDQATGNPVTLLSMLCNPGTEISQGASDVHGITQEELHWATPTAWALQHLKMALDALEQQGDVILVGHNSDRFDIPLIHRILPSAGFNTYLTVDTYTMAMREWPEKEHKLGLLYEWYVGKPAVKAHDAAADCWMVAEILHKYLTEKGMTLMELSRQQEEPRLMEVWPWGKYKGQRVDDLPQSFLNWCRTNYHEVHPDIEATICDKLGCDTWTK